MRTQMRTNAISWNPMEAFHFTTASEDHNCYTFDMRRLETALNVHQDHVAAVYVHFTHVPRICARSRANFIKQCIRFYMYTNTRFAHTPHT